MEGKPEARLTYSERLRVAVTAEVDPKTVDAYDRGRQMKRKTQLAVELALDACGYGDLIRRDAADHSMKRGEGRNGGTKR